VGEKIKKYLLWKNISSLPYFRGFLRAVEGQFYQNLTLDSPILDVGIGDGHFNSVTFKSAVDVGIDPFFSSIRESNKIGGSRLGICGAGDKLPFADNYFKSGFSNSVLEHIENLPPVLKEINRVLNPGAMFIISVPNDNFSKNLSVARALKSLKLSRAADAYQKFFNCISRHFHPDPHEKWVERINSAGFEIMESWRYFSKRSLQILEWGHLFGVPSWISKKLFSRWVLFPKWWNLGMLYEWLLPYWSADQKCEDGAYSFFVCRKR